LRESQPEFCERVRITPAVQAGLLLQLRYGTGRVAQDVLQLFAGYTQFIPGRYMAKTWLKLFFRSAYSPVCASIW